MATPKKTTTDTTTHDPAEEYMPNATAGPRVLAAINEVQATLGQMGISKDRSFGNGGYGSYKFRGIDDVYAALSPLIAKAGLVIVPNIVSRDFREATAKSGNGMLYYTTLTVRYVLYSTEDGSSIEATVIGEAMDSSDKSANKAMSAAYKYMAFQVFCIPTEGDNDTENSNHQAAGPMTQHSPAQPATAAGPQRPPATNRLSLAELEAALAKVTTVPELGELFFDNTQTITAHPDLHSKFTNRKNQLNQPA